MRTDRVTEAKALSLLYKDRKDKVQKRKSLEAEVTKQNGKLIQLLTEILKPICSKVGYGIHMAIYDGKIEFSTEAGYQFKRGGASARISIFQAKVDIWMRDEKSIKKHLRLLEKNMRLFKLMSGPNIQLRPSNMIVISIQTRNRYF